MRRQLGVGLLTKIAKNGGLTNSLLPKSASPSPFLKPDSSQFHHRRSFSESSTLSRSSLWKLCSSNGVREAIRNGGFPSSLLARRVFSSALLQGRSKFPVAMRDRRLFSSFSLDQRRRRGSFFRRFTADGVVLGLIATNVAVFILWKVADNSFMVKNFMISVDHILSGRLHTLITNAFSHRDAVHLFSNMIGLYFFGTSIAQTFGPQYLLKLYLAGALTGSIFYLVYQAFIAPSIYRDDLRGVSHSRVPALGASAATSAIMLLDIFLYPKRIIFLDLIFPVPAFLVGVFIVGKDILRVLQGDLEVAGSAHLGGAAVATVAWLQKRKGRFGLPMALELEGRSKVGLFPAPFLQEGFSQTHFCRGDADFLLSIGVLNLVLILMEIFPGELRFFLSLDLLKLWSSFLRRLTTNGVVLGLIVTNAAVFILWRVAGIPFMVKNFTISVDNILSGRLHTLITNAFSHINQFHIISNMITLYFFGTAIGRYFGPQYLLKLYLAGALAGSIFYVAYKAFIAPLVHKNDKRGLPHSMDPALGASGATTAILLLYIFLFPKKTILIDFIIPVPAVLVGVLFIGKDILMVLQGDRDVAGSAHLGGAAVATVAWLQKRKGRFGRF
ncbi:hypothetical protein SASPL_151518 [Salvia splendens]|uniref:Peptidase S54 rhomboid domain-containing protein n=1 Tax=Salvia splendens TaxID=180675 RepID=A0A8X8W8H7_SALSN|nr:hypothetical protein SASPL_151518 [Salvia splendens]